MGWSIKHLLPCKRNNHFCIYFALEESGRKGFGVLLRFKQENSFQPAKPEAAIFWLYFTSGKEKRKMRFRAFPRLFCFLCWYHDWHWLRHVGTLLFALQRDTLFDIFFHFCSSQKMGMVVCDCRLYWILFVRKTLRWKFNYMKVMVSSVCILVFQSTLMSNYLEAKVSYAFSILKTKFGLVLTKARIR